jgi:hypothetical protein
MGGGGVTSTTTHAGTWPVKSGASTHTEQAPGACSAPGTRSRLRPAGVPHPGLGGTAHPQRTRGGLAAAAWPDGVVYGSRTARRWRFRKRALKCRQFGRMAQQLTGGGPGTRRGVDLSARRAAVRDVREAVKVCMVFGGGSSAGHGGVSRRR